MIVYDPLWATMAKRGATTYTLRVKYGLSHATVQRLQAGRLATAHTLDKLKLCRIFDCALSDIAVYVRAESDKQHLPK